MGKRRNSRSEYQGIYVFRVRPHMAIELRVVPEPSNKYDHNVMKVVLTLLTETPEYLQSDERVRRNDGMVTEMCASDLYSISTIFQCIVGFVVRWLNIIRYC